MATETVGGVALAPPTSVGDGRAARLRQLAPFLPAGLILVGLFFVPIALMFVFSLWDTTENLDIVPTWDLHNFQARYVSRRWARLALLFIIVPFWTSYLLRVYSWQAILGEKGALNQVLMGLGVISEPSRLFVYNDVGTFIVLTYVYLPFAILVLYASLDRFDFTQLTAAQDLRARPLAAFRHAPP